MATNNPKGRRPGLVEKKPRRRRPRKLPADYLSVQEAADVAGVGVPTIRRHLKDIGAKKLGHRYIIGRDRLKAWVAALPDAT